MKAFFKFFLMTLGVIFLLFFLLVGYLLIANPFDIWPLLEGRQTSDEADVSQGADTDQPVDAHPYLSEEQEQFISNFGIDPATLPTEVTPEMIECAEENLGQDRINELLGGAEPTPSDVWRVRGCL